MNNEQIGNSQYDFILKSYCSYLTETEIDGMIYLKKEKIVFRSTMGIDKSMADHLKKLDDWLYQDEIQKIESHQESDTFIDYRDIHDIKIIAAEDDSLQIKLGLTVVNGIKYNQNSTMIGYLYFKFCHRDL